MPALGYKSSEIRGEQITNNRQQCAGRICLNCCFSLQTSLFAWSSEECLGWIISSLIENLLPSPGFLKFYPSAHLLMKQSLVLWSKICLFYWRGHWFCIINPVISPRGGGDRLRRVLDILYAVVFGFSQIFCRHFYWTIGYRVLLLTV